MLVLGAGFALLAAADAELVLAAAAARAAGCARADDGRRLHAARHVAPAGTVTEAFAVMVMGIVAGTAVGNALGGALVESSSYDAAVLVAGATAAAGSALALARRRSVSPRGPATLSGVDTP